MCICQVIITWLYWIYLHIYWFCVLIVRMWSLFSFSPSHLWNRKEMHSGASLIEKFIQTFCLRPNQTGQRSVSKGNACSILFIGRDKGLSKRMSETLSRGLFFSSKNLFFAILELLRGLLCMSQFQRPSLVHLQGLFFLSQ